MTSTPSRLETPVAWPLRAWFVAEMGFAIASSSAVFLAPAASETNFAWPVRPVVVAALFGAIYLAALLLMTGGFLTRVWEHARVIVLPSAVFTAVMLVPTFLHLDRFSTGSISFAIWLASYVLPPPVFIACYIWQQRRSGPVGAGVTMPLPRMERGIFLFNGMALALFAAAAMVFPVVVQAIAPFAFTPLTARALAGFLTLAALLQVSMALENDWMRARLASVLLIALPVLAVFQLIRFAGEVRWANPSLWIFLADLALVAALCARLWLRPPPARG